MRKRRVKPRLKFLPMMLIHLAWWSIYFAIARDRTAFAMFALMPWILFSAAFTEWAIGHQVITGWPKNRA